MCEVDSSVNEWKQENEKPCVICGRETLERCKSKLPDGTVCGAAICKRCVHCEMDGVHVRTYTIAQAVQARRTNAGRLALNPPKDE